MIPYTGNPSAIQAPSPAPGVAVAPIVNTLQDGIDDLNSANFAQQQKVTADFIAWLTANSSFIRTGFFGGGFDGSAVLDGANTVTWASKVGSVYTMTSSAYVQDLTIANGVSLLPAGFFLYVNGTCNVQVGGKIAHSGANGSGASGGLSAAVGSTAAYASGFGSGASGGTGVGSNASSPADGGFSESATVGIGGNGGNSGATAGGTGATSTMGSKVRGAHRQMAAALQGYATYLSSGSPAGPIAIIGGVGGGAGAGDGANNGGGGGGGGGHFIVVARTLQLDGTIEAKGGNGAAGVAGNAGGGGGGSGGLIACAYASKAGAGSFVVTGGSLGAGAGTGNAGTAGKNGLALEFQL